MLLGECAKCGQPVTDTQLKAGRGAQLGTRILCERCAPQPDSETIAAPAMGDATAHHLLAVTRPSNANPSTPSAVPFDQVAVPVEQDPHFIETAAPAPTTPDQPLAPPPVARTRDSSRRAISRPSSTTRPGTTATADAKPPAKRNVLLAAGLATAAFSVTVLCYLVFSRNTPAVAPDRSPDAPAAGKGPSVEPLVKTQPAAAAADYENP